MKIAILFISDKFVKRFLATTFNYFYYLHVAETFMMCLNVFYVAKNDISARFDQKQIPHTPPLSKSLTLVTSCL